ncbi:MAG: hypothetical protein WDO13_13470 [Verrucomicrobiota bacterium]
MKTSIDTIKNCHSKLGRAPLLLLWLLGVPIPVLLLIWFFQH